LWLENPHLEAQRRGNFLNRPFGVPRPFDFALYLDFVDGRNSALRVLCFSGLHEVQLRWGAILVHLPSTRMFASSGSTLFFVDLQMSALLRPGIREPERSSVAAGVAQNQENSQETGLRRCYGRRLSRQAKMDAPEYLFQTYAATETLHRRMAALSWLRGRV